MQHVRLTALFWTAEEYNKVRLIGLYQALAKGCTPDTCPLSRSTALAHTDIGTV